MAQGLRAVADRMEWVMRFPLETAPGLVFVGARSRPEGLAPGNHAGAGETLDAAFAACMGEAAEYLSQVERTGDLLPEGHGLPAADAWHGTGRAPGPDAVRAERLHDGAAFAVDADRALRRPGGAPPVRLGLGCAAGKDLEAARLAAVLELVERDAAALWWRGGRTARPLDLGDPEVLAAMGRAAGWRGGLRGRRAWFLDLSVGPGAAVVAAISDDEAGGRLAFGTAARTGVGEAILAAAREMMQSELALALRDERLGLHGPGAETDADRAFAARAAMDPQDPRLTARGAPRSHREGDKEASSGRFLRRLVKSLFECKHHIYSVTLARPSLGVPVAWAMSPTLQPDPSELETERLRVQRRSAEALPSAPPLY